MLQSIGVQPHAEAVYEAILTHWDWGISDLASRLHLSDDEVREALRELNNLSLLAPADSANLPVRPVDPALGLAHLLAKADADMEQRRQEIESARAAAASFTAQAVHGSSLEGHLRLDGADAVRRHLERLAVSVQTEFLSINPVKGSLIGDESSGWNLQMLLLERGIQVRELYQQCVNTRLSSLRKIEELAEAGGEVRTTPLLPGSVIVHDACGVLVPINNDDPEEGAIAIRTPVIVQLMQSLFENLWTAAVPLDAEIRADDTGLTPMERQLLELLCEGHTDDLAARRLGVSISTVRRLMSRLMSRLSARSRFQAGVHLASSGWLRAASDF